MSLYDEIYNYQPVNQQEANDREQMLRFMEDHPDYLDRCNQTGHVTTSIWTVNRERTKTLLVYHNIYHSWSWIGGHADGEEKLSQVALRELEEETGIRHARLVRDEIFSLEILAVNGHMKKGTWIPSHLHFNVTYLAEADEEEEVTSREEENTDVRWWPMEEVERASTEPWMIETVYKKLMKKDLA